MRLVVLGHEEAAARVLVQSVDDARPRDSADPAELTLAMMEEGVDQGVLVMADGRMHHDAGRFVEHKHVGILVEDLQWNVLRQRFGSLRFGKEDADLFPTRRAVRRFDDAAVDGHVPVIDQALHDAARHGRELLAQKGVQPEVGAAAFDGEDFGAFGHEPGG